MGKEQKWEIRRIDSIASKEIHWKVVIQDGIKFTKDILCDLL